MTLSTLESAPIERVVEGLRSDNVEEREASYRETIRRYKRLVYAIARRFTPDVTLADDIFQESFLRLFKSIHRLEEPKAFSGFFRRIVLSAAQDCLAGQRGQERERESIDPATLAYEFDTDYLDVFFLLPYISRLPELQQKIIQLAFFEGLTSSEVAERLGISSVSARVNKHRALRRIRHWLDQDAKLLRTKAKHLVRRV